VASPRRTLLAAALGAWSLAAGVQAAVQTTVPVYQAEVVHAYPHDPTAYTEGLFYLDGYLYESTGIEGQSSIRKERLETGEVLQKVDVPAQYFGEGIVNWKNRLVSLTWRSHVGFVRDLATFKPSKQFTYEGEGWALTQDGTRLIMSDGTPQLRFLDPNSLHETGRLTVTLAGKPIRYVNELEWVKGEIYANVWQTDFIIRIDPGSGAVVGIVNLRGLLGAEDRRDGHPEVLNGIAYDKERDRLFVTGKYWPKLFEIRLRRVGDLEPKNP